MKKYWLLLLGFVIALLPLSAQAVSWNEVFADMTTDELIKVQALLNVELASRNETIDAVFSVYVSTSGSKYHASSSCSGMKKALKVSMESALDCGYTPCKKCYK